MVPESTRHIWDKPVRRVRVTDEGSQNFHVVDSWLQTTVVVNKSISGKLSSLFHSPAGWDLDWDNSGRLLKFPAEAIIVTHRVLTLYVLALNASNVLLTQVAHIEITFVWFVALQIFYVKGGENKNKKIVVTNPLVDKIFNRLVINC